VTWLPDGVGFYLESAPDFKVRWDNGLHWYVDAQGRVLAKNFDDAKRACEDRARKAEAQTTRRTL
jgi:hypothetical protein